MRLPGADVQRRQPLPWRVRGEGQHVGAGDVTDVHEVAGLLAVLEHKPWTADEGEPWVAEYRTAVAPPLEEAPPLEGAPPPAAFVSISGLTAGARLASISDCCATSTKALRYAANMADPAYTARARPARP